MIKTNKTPTLPKGAVSLALPTGDSELTAVLASKPTMIELVGPIANVLAQACALSRQGFTVDTEAMSSMFPTTGTGIVVMVPGDPDPFMVDEANRAIQEALCREQFAMFDAAKRAEAAAKEQKEQAEKDAAKAVITAQIAAQQESLRQLQATLAAA